MRVQVGEAIPPFEREVRVEEMKTTAALLADPNPIHWDPRSVRELGMGDRPVNQGPLNMGYVQTMLARWAGGRHRIADFRVRFLGSVLAGDTVRASGTVTGLREDERRGRVADCDVRLEVLEDGGTRVVLQGTACVAVPIDERSAE